MDIKSEREKKGSKCLQETNYALRNIEISKSNLLKEIHSSNQGDESGVTTTYKRVILIASFLLFCF